MNDGYSTVSWRVLPDPEVRVGNGGLSGLRVLGPCPFIGAGGRSMRGWVLGVAAALCLAGLPASAHENKRTDACGCHHQWGLRHCHPKKKTPRCEAPARSTGKQVGKPKITWRSEHTADL